MTGAAGAAGTGAGAGFFTIAGGALGREAAFFRRTAFAGLAFFLACAPALLAGGFFFATFFRFTLFLAAFFRLAFFAPFFLAIIVLSSFLEVAIDAGKFKRNETARRESIDDAAHSTGN